MKFLLVAFLCLGSVSAFSAEESFEEMKAKMTAHLDQKITHINEAKACVSAATTSEALKDCKKKMHDAKKEWKHKHHEEKKSKK
jgi:hypothetical protein